MAEKIITVVSVKEKSKDDNKWIELVDQDGKTHRVFASLQGNDGAWLHFEDKFEMLLDSQNKALKLTKEKKGQFWNVIGVEEVKNIFEQQAVEKVADETRDITRVSIERQVSLYCAKDLAVAERITVNNIIDKADEFYNWLREVQGETKTSTTSKPEGVEETNEPETGQGSGETIGEESGDLSWEAIRGKINTLMKAKHPQYTTDKMIERLTALGGQSKNVKEAYESLSDGNKLSFGCQIEEDLKTLTKEE